METLRTSSYLIPVKLESEPGKYMLIHGYTGAIDIVTESLLKKIQAVASGVDLPEDTLQALIKRGYITTRSQEEEYAYVARMAKALHKKECLLHTSFTWVVTYNCNFRCPYCFEGREQKDGEIQIVFTKKMVDQAYHAMELIQPNKKLRRNVITLYGGEPLLAENKEIVSYIINEGQKRGYTFFAVTNGYDLNSYIDLFSPSAIKKIQVTIDGPKNFHNQRRIHHKYVETFDNIISNIKLVLNTGIKVSVRINTDKNNVEQISELKKQLKILGLYNYPNFSLYSAILIDNDSITKIERDKLDFVSIKSYVEKNRQNEVLELCQDYGIYKIINEAISTNRAIAFRSTYCTSQTGEYVLARWEEFIHV